MFLSRNRGFLFLRVPKTASTSIITHLCENVSVGVEDSYIESLFFSEGHNTRGFVNVHGNIPDLINHGLLSENEVDSLRVYGIFRDPIERFVSMSKFIFNRGRPQKENVDINEIVSFGLSYVRKSFTYAISDIPGKEFPLYPQTHWLIYRNKPISNIFFYPHFEDALTQMCDNSEMRHYLRKSAESQSTLDSCLIDKIRTIYESDFLLKDRLNRSPEREPI